MGNPLDRVQKMIQTHPKINIRGDVWDTFGLLCSLKGVGKAEGVAAAIELYVRQNRKLLLDYQVQQRRSILREGEIENGATTEHPRISSEKGGIQDPHTQRSEDTSESA